MAYQYSMIQVPPNVKVSGTARGNEAATYLQDLANKMAGDGWEFYRVDTIGVVQTPGCLAALLGAKQLVVDYYVITFRRGTAN